MDPETRTDDEGTRPDNEGDGGARDEKENGGREDDDVLNEDK